MAVIGIDLGTTYSAAGRCLPGGKPEVVSLDGDRTMPSVVGLLKNGTIAVGRKAKRNQANAPQNTIVEVKRKMGSQEMVPLGDRQFTPQDVSAMILKKIKELAEEELGEPITGAVISCPAYFKDPQRKATEEAGRIADLNVMRIVNEPTAAAYAYGVNQDTGEGEKLFVVYDLGGGTFDVTIIRMLAGVLEVLGTGGDPNLGGGDFDDRIVGWVMEHLEKIPGYAASLTDDKRRALKMRLKTYAEEAKIALCNSSDENPSYTFQIPSVDIFEGKPVSFNETLTMEKFEELIMDLMKGSVKWIDEALTVPKEKYKYTEKSITAILLVGGSTRVPLVKRILKDRFPDTPIRGQESGIDPDQIVALGAAIFASDIDPESDEVAETTLVDVTGHTLSVAVMDETKGREMLAAIIPKETQIPCTAAHDFQSFGHGQRQCRVKVFQGEGEEIDLDKVTMIGEFLIDIDPIEPPTPIRIGLDLDANGLLVAHATNKLSGQRFECNINYDDSSQISPEKLEEKRKALDAQLQAVLGQAANPLDGTGPAAGGQPQNPWTRPAAGDGDGQFAQQPSGQPMAGQPMAGQPMAGQPMAGQPMAGQPMAGQPMAGQPMAGQPMAGQPMAGQPTAASPADPAAAMNPIMRALYQRAMTSFPKVPPDRQPALIELVSQIEAVARTGDQQKLMTLYPQLQQLMEGVQ